MDLMNGMLQAFPPGRSKGSSRSKMGHSYPTSKVVYYRQWFGVPIFLGNLSNRYILNLQCGTAQMTNQHDFGPCGRARLRCCTFGRGGSRLKLLTNATTFRQDLTSTFRIAPTLCFERSAAGSKDVLGPLGLRVGQFLGKAVSQTAEVNKSTTLVFQCPYEQC